MPRCSADDCAQCNRTHGDDDGPGPEPEDQDQYDEYDEYDEESKPGAPFYDSAAKCARLVGVEVEYNNRASLKAWLRKWRGGIHCDGSCGWEAVTAPVAGRHIAGSLIDLARDLRESGTTCDDKCGVHVHVDASDITWQCMYRLLGVYALVEPILYLCAGQQRINNRFSVICGHSYGMALASSDRKGAVLHVALTDAGVSALSAVPAIGRERAKAMPDKKSNGRYKGLNILPWIAGRQHRYATVGYWATDSTGLRTYLTRRSKIEKRKDCTIEFRMHRNTLDANRLIGWATLCRDIVDWSSRATDADMLALPRSALRALCQHIAPGSARWILRRVREWRAVTTSSRDGTSTASGQLANRRIHLYGGTYSCAA